MSLAEREDMYDKEVLEVKKKVDKLLAHKTPQYKQGYNKAIDDVREKLLDNGFIFTEHALNVFDEIAEHLKSKTTD